MSKSKQARRALQRGRKAGPGEPDDFAELPFGYMARWGRFIVQQGMLSAEEHAEMVNAFLEGAPDVTREQESRRARLLEILDEADSVDLLARAGLTYMQIDPDTYKEWESDRSPAHIEYLALQALGAGLSAPKDIDPMRAAQLTGEAIDIVREMFESASMLLMIDAVRAHRERPDDPTIEYALRTRLQSLGVRGTGYAEHLIKVIHGCFDLFDQQCRELLGFTATEALTLTYGIADLISARIEPIQRQMAATHAEILGQLKRERRRRNRGDRHFPDWMLDLPPTAPRGTSQCLQRSSYSRIHDPWQW